MTYQTYSIEQKIQFFDLCEELGAAVAAARQSGIPYGTCRHWLRKKDQLREVYQKALAQADVQSENNVRRYRRHSIEEKINCIKSVETGTSVWEVSQQHECDESLIRSWYKRRDELLALYYSQNDAQEVESYLNDLAATVSGAGEDEVPKDELTKDLTNKIKKKEKEIEFLKDKITYLENLNKILQERSGPIKKKNFSRRLNEASNQDVET